MKDKSEIVKMILMGFVILALAILFFNWVWNSKDDGTKLCEGSHNLTQSKADWCNKFYPPKEQPVCYKDNQSLKWVCPK